MKPERDVTVSRQDSGRSGEQHADAVVGGRDGWVVVLAGAVLLLAALAVVGARVGTEMLAAIDALAAGTGTSGRPTVVGRPGFHLVVAAIAARIVRDASILAGGVAIVLGCWVAFTGSIRVLGSR